MKADDVRKDGASVLSENRCDIIIALADYNMNVSEVSKKLYMHRNTVAYNIQRIQEITGKNPLNFYDLCDLVQIVKNRRVMNRR